MVYFFLCRKYASMISPCPSIRPTINIVFQIVSLSLPLPLSIKINETRYIKRYKTTRAHLVPPIILGLAKHPIVDKFDLSSLKAIVSGAAPLGAEVGCLLLVA
jgi:hypothetical protein